MQGGDLVKKIREGYKITELGEIPEEWEVKKLEDLGKSIIGLTTFNEITTIRYYSKYY